MTDTSIPFASSVAWQKEIRMGIESSGWNLEIWIEYAFLILNNILI